MKTKFVKISTPSTKQPRQCYPICSDLHQVFITNAKKCRVYCLYTRSQFFYVAVKIGGDSKKLMGLAAISFEKAFKRAARRRPRGRYLVVVACRQKSLT
jgi:hypothetical protein